MDKKFIAIFIGLILIPLAFLSYFGFKIIYYQEELEKRRIFNRQKELVEKIHDEFKRQIILKYRYFYDLINNTKIDFFTLLRKNLENRRNGFKIIFFMNITGQFIFPNYVEFTMGDLPNYFDNKFIEIFNKTRKLEKERKFEDALTEYKKFLKNKLPVLYIAQVKYEIASLYFKNKKFENALSICEEISSRYPYLLSKDGIPFLFLSSLLMTKIYLEKNEKYKLLEIFSDLVDSSINGDLILTNTCLPLLKEIKVMLKKAKISSEYLIDKIDFLMDQIYFGEIFSSKIERALYKYLTTNSREVEFLMSNPGEPQALVLYFPYEKGNLKGLVGFEYDLEKIINEVLQKVKKEEFYIEIGKQRRELKGKLIHSEILSPLTPQFKVFISIKDEAFSQLRKLKISLVSTIIFFLITSIIFGIFIIVRDVSRKMELSKMRTEFISNVTHELKAPLSSIMLYIETLLLGRIKERKKKREYLSIIMNETQRLSRLIDNVLEFSKIQIGQKYYNFRKIDIRKIVDEVLKLFEYEFKKENFKLKLEIPKEPIVISVDHDAISQVFINIISNAIKFSEKKKEIKLSIRKLKNYVEIVIEDKGIGIPERDLPYIFNKFYRVKNEKTKGKTGAGIGLSLVKYIVEAHGGEVKVKSKVGKGTIFKIYLPVSKINNLGDLK
ncbi:HAMP domain-containing histidine kinase [Candidatus Aminicenantes bacterium AC-708-M15]|jgi:signal transduction histidine kinase|nr:HAMP domain-containing histidine kinase [SCandidatus Aminicenantes bacterium Aminicenantia_JdfR_composite]MCP2596942.1 HAMP domain-containing histidine kinase [Candidatus Aminicenantes bacterium AC-335-G13]MCP2603980.1 HAMP domain-containing histidine kinase [Candidatus Aminicenantes bacterium AC-708-M15]MCP2621196.1 HAMP domain-containing histidine kinase [Candidatus Aminicenantes bacterium AC-334-E05]